MNERIFAGLNDQQAAAVSAVRGPVCILAGAGSGKTTTITRRIANQIADGAFATEDILAVTFTDKAAKEMAERVRRIGALGVRTRTFHAEALAQYRRFSSDTAEIVPSKGQILAPLIARLPMPHKFTSVRDVATEIEWAKNRCVSPARYKEEVQRDGHVTPVPADLMAGIYGSYERKKEIAGLMDFEDLLARTIDMLAADARALGAVRARYRAITVDEYQDVNLLQQTLLEAWLGDRDDLCVVGDDYQSIFGFTGATPRYLLSFSERYPLAHVVRLTANYRSSPQVLATANRLVPKLGGSPKSLRAVNGDGPEPVFREHNTGADEIAWILAQCRSLRNKGVPWEDMAILYRINGRSEDIEEAFSKDRVPYQVRDGAFLRRPAARGLLARLKRANDGEGDGDVAGSVGRIVRALGLAQQPGDDVDPSEATRQADLARLLALAEEFHAARTSGRADADGGRRADAQAFIADLERRFAPDREGRGVQILTYHRAKGLEFEAVFLPRMEDKELPFALAKSEEDVAEERRLLYVGITRAKKYLFVSWAASREGERRRSPKRSPFLDEIRPRPASSSGRGSGSGLASGSSPASGSSSASGSSPGARAAAPAKATVGDDHLALFAALKDWRLQAARAGAVPPFVVFHDQTLARIAESRPRNVIELGRISGVGPTKIARYGSDVLDLVGSHTA